MSQIKISELPAATVPLSGDEVFPLVQSNTTKKATVSSIASSAATIAALRGVTPSSGQYTTTQGYYAAGDGGGNQFRGYTTGGPYVDNNGTIIVPTGGDGTKAWIAVDSRNVNVKQFGAYGNGSTDDTAAIQAAVTSLTSGGAVLFPDGTYKITSTINLVSNTRYYGTPTSVIRQYTANTNVLTATSKTNVTVDSLVIYAVGSFSSISNGAGVSAVTSTYVTVQNCTIKNHRGAGVLFYGSDYGNILNNLFIDSPVRDTDNHTQAAYDVGVMYDSSYNHVLGNMCISGQGVGVAIQTLGTGVHCDYNIVEGNTIENARQYGIMCYNSDASTSSVKFNTIDGNSLKNITGAIPESTYGYVYGTGIYVQNAENNTIVGNTIDGTHTAPVVFVDLLAPGAIGTTNVLSATISGNTIRNAHYYGITMRDPNSEGVTSNIAVVSENSISNVTKTAIQIFRRGYVCITGNTISTVTASGIAVDNNILMPQISITGNNIRDVDGAGVSLSYAEHAAVTGNVIYNCGNHGVYVIDSREVSIANNLVEEFDVNGVYFDPTVINGICSGNRVNGKGSAVSTRGYGFYAKVYADRMNIAANVISEYEGNYAPFQLAAPSTGTWALRDTVWNIAPASGGVIGWVCTSGGTPGTWKAFGTIA